MIHIFLRLQAERGLQQAPRTDNGPELLGEAFASGAKHNGMAIQYIQPGKPDQNAYREGFNRTSRDELFDQHLCTTPDDPLKAAHW
jgi:putative transposase